MRTTLTIDDDVLEVVRGLAEARGVSLGEALSTLARRGIKEIRLVTGPDGFPVLDIPDDFPPISDEDVARLLSEFP